MTAGLLRDVAEQLAGIDRDLARIERGLGVAAAVLLVLGGAALAFAVMRAVAPCVGP